MTLPAIEFDRVSFAYPAPGADGAGARPVLEQITLRVEPGERLGLLGPNGGGKTTLVRLTAGLLHGYSGSIRVFGLPPDRARRAGLIGYLPQRNEAEMAFPLSARQVVALGAERGQPPWRMAPRASRQRVADALRLVGAEAFADRPVGALSGGQLQRVLLARAVAFQPRLLLLDEPTVGVDLAGQQQFFAMLDALRRQFDLTMVIVSHDLRAIAGACDRIACLNRTLHCHVSPAGLTPQVLAEVFEHDVAAAFGDIHLHAHPARECPDPSHRDTATGDPDRSRAHD